MLCVGNSSVVKIYIIRPKPGPVWSISTSYDAKYKTDRLDFIFTDILRLKIIISFYLLRNVGNLTNCILLAN